MKIELRAERPNDDAACRADTGRSLHEWFALIDAFGGPEKGRREIGGYLQDSHRIDPWWSTTLNIAYEAHHGLREKDGRAKGYMICATKNIKATPDDCFRHFTTAAALDAWLGPDHALDFRDAGSLANGDGNRAVIRKVSPGKTIRMVWEQPDAAPDTPVEIKFQPAAGKTTVMVSHDRLQTREDADGMRRAWGDALDRLKARVEAG